MKRAVILVLDSFGIGATHDAAKFGDAGANTLGHIAAACASGLADVQRQGPLYLPNLSRLGLMHAAREANGNFPSGTDSNMSLTGAWGFAEELSSGKDTSSGHWEMAGVPVQFDWGYFTQAENSFPESFLSQLIERSGIPGVLGNCHASGTEIIARLGEQHIQSGKAIVYTSADSVFQIACHEKHFGLDKLINLCQIAYELLAEYNICRVIARPFTGTHANNFKRTGNRRDFSVPPPDKTLLDKVVESGHEVLAVGKISDIFAGQGVTQKVKASGLENLINATVDSIRSAPDGSLVFTNFVDFDSEYGHRRDLPGYARALEYFDSRLPEILAQIQDEDILIITADHGCDPSWPGSDHTREHIPILVYGETINPGSLGRRKTFADIGQSLATHLSLPPTDFGSSFLKSASH